MTIARNLVEIFRDVPPGHPLFRRFSLIAPEELPAFERRLSSIGPDGALTVADEAFLALALSYVEPRQRLGLLDRTLRGPPRRRPLRRSAKPFRGLTVATGSPTSPSGSTGAA